jgi:hypothetical protein
MKTNRNNFVFILCVISMLPGCMDSGSDGKKDPGTFIVPVDDPKNLDPELQAFAESFFKWRIRTQPITPDDVPRVQRPDGWTPDYSPAALRQMRAQYRTFKHSLNQINRSGWSKSDSVDYLLLRSAIERIHWELDVLRLPYINPDFYIQQTVGAFYDLLIIGSPITDTRTKNMILRLQSIPATLKHARIHLTEPVLSFTDIALANCTHIREKMESTLKALKPLISTSLFGELNKNSQEAVSALETYAGWLRQKRQTMPDRFSIGREAYLYFLRKIALIPSTPEELLTEGRLAWNRAVSFESIEINRNRDLPELGFFSTIEQMIGQSLRDEETIRNFLRTNKWMTVPDWMHHYTLREIPAYIEPLSYIGSGYDLTWETRLKEDAVRYIPHPSPDLPYFYRSMAKDARPIIVHEGIPGHYFQMALSWLHPDPIRRRYIDSGPNEGIAFYMEEMLLQSGLFDERPKVKEMIYSFMRLRALRVEVDIRLALGTFTLKEAAEYLTKTVPMDLKAAEEEARFFASTPGQAITYQIGKLQILRFLADSRTVLKEKFTLHDFHDRLLLNGNVPIALQKWEYLGLKDEIMELWQKM